MTEKPSLMGMLTNLFAGNALHQVEQAKKRREDIFERTVLKSMPDEAKGGKVLPLVLYPDKRLREPCVPVEDFGPEFQQLVQDMALTMYMCGGVGLAAPQVGSNLEVFICDVAANAGEARSAFRVFVNPVILWASEETEKMLEACLSLPGVKETIERPSKIGVRAETVKGMPFETTLEGWPARVFLHEFAHLHGELMIDEMGKLQRKYAEKALAKLGRELDKDVKFARERAERRRRKLRGR